MPLLPTLRINYDFVVTALYSTLMLGPTDQNVIQRRNKSPYGALHHILMKGSDLLASEEAVIYEFYCERRGGWEAFAAFDPSDEKLWVDVYLGTGDGIVTDYELKGKNASGISVTVDGVANADWAPSAGAGTDGQDVLIFTPAPTGIIKAKFTGARYFPNCVFIQKGLDRQRLSYALRNYGLEIQEISQ